MTSAALVLSGWLAGILTAVFLTILALRSSGDRLNNTQCDLSEITGAGGGESFNHGDPIRARECNDHA